MWLGDDGIQDCKRVHIGCHRTIDTTGIAVVLPYDIQRSQLVRQIKVPIACYGVLLRLTFFQDLALTLCFFFSRLAQYSGPLRRATLVTSFALQSAIVFAVAAIIQAGLVNGALDTINTDIMLKDEIPISLLSFQAAGQIVGSRAFGTA